LPFVPPIIAPLSTKDDLSFYVRGKADANRLSYQILQGEGVFLITGYRGVGKTTMINQALAICSILERQQQDSRPWHVVPIFVNLAKASGITNVLRLCIRKLYNNLISDDSTKKLLTQEERNQLLYAYLRATYNVNLQQVDNAETVKHIESQLSLNVKLAGLISPIASGLGDSLPSFGGSVRASRDWKNTLERTISLPDYDEDKAEEDIVNLIKKLAQSCPPTRSERIKLVFVFDEIDKLKEEDQDFLLNQLKNLFLQRHTVFLFVTSKEFYYRLVQERKVEDAMLTSYFSWIEMVPLFTSEDTLALLKQLILSDKSSLAEESEAIKFLRTFARYLTYRSRGIPREIIRELQGLLQWSRDDLQAYLTSRLERYHAVLVYEQLQRELELILDRVTPVVPSTNSGVSELPSSGSNGTANSTAQATSAPEPVWMNEERQEQMKRGLYALVEELLDRGSLEMNPDTEECKKIYENNFTMFSRQDFKSILDRLILQLPKVRLPITAGSPLVQYYSGSEIAFFQELPETEGGKRKLAVLAAFYALTGRQMASTTEAATRLRDIDLTFDQIEELLEKDEPLLKQRALSVLQLRPSPFPSVINLQLCHIFVEGQILNFRLDAASLLQDAVACSALYQVDKDVLEHFLESETNGKLLQECIRLIDTSAELNEGNRSTGLQLLLRLVNRQQASASRMPESILNGAVSALIKITDDRNSLLQVVERLKPNQDIPAALIPLLESLESKSDFSLIELLVSHNFTGISTETLQFILEEQPVSKLLVTWNNVIEKKQLDLAQRILVAISMRAFDTSKEEIVRNQVITWLNSPIWDEEDQHILNEVIAQDQSLRITLLKVVDQDKQQRILVTLPETIMPSSLGIDINYRPSFSLTERQEHLNRRNMIDRVRRIWIEGVLERNLYLTARIALNLQVRPGAVTNPSWMLVQGEVDNSVRFLPPGTSITQIYYQASGELLILGEPGSGKTTLLLELTSDLLRRAEQDDSHPIPVVFNLLSWTLKRQNIGDWLVEELSAKYQVPRKLGQSWVDVGRILPLLDGLDEVEKASREACINALNRYKQEHSWLHLVVCSRTAEYLAESVRLQLQTAIDIQPLTQQQIEVYLLEAGEQMAAVRTALDVDRSLQEIATTPLMLNTIAVAGQESSIDFLAKSGSTEESRRQIFASYVQRMLRRRIGSYKYTPQRTTHWLSWLAMQMRSHSQTEFFLERMQPNWLPGDGLRQVYFVTTVLITLLLVWLSFGLFGWLNAGIIGAIISVLLGSFSLAILGMLDPTIHPVEIVTWSWKRLTGNRRKWLIWLGLWVLAGLGIGLFDGLILGLSFGLLGLLSFGLFGALQGEPMDYRNFITPNMGIRNSVRNGLSIGLLFGLMVGLLFGLSTGLFFGPHFGLLFGLSIGLLFAVLSGLLFGGRACIQHAVLRFLLWRTGVIPLNYVPFLDYATEALILRKVGGGYIFIHRLLLDYFASLKSS